MKRMYFEVRVFLILAACVISMGLTGALVNGCSTTNRNVYRAESAFHITVKTAMGLWEVLVSQHKVTPDQELKVKAAYEKVQGSAILLCDAGKSLSAVSGSSTPVAAAFEQAVAQFTQDKTDLFNLLTTFGVNLQ